jgi:peptide deformylase
MVEVMLNLRYFPHSDLDRSLPELAPSGQFDVEPGVFLRGAIAKDALMRIADGMFETMAWHNGVGLAANQVGTSFRIYVSAVPGDQVRMYLNPRLLQLHGDPVETDEGCLSFPGIKERVVRCPIVKIRAIMSANDYEAGVYTETELTGLAAQVAQHECEHLAGTHFGRHLGPVARDQVRRKVAKALRERRA